MLASLDHGWPAPRPAAVESSEAARCASQPACCAARALRLVRCAPSPCGSLRSLPRPPRTRHRAARSACAARNAVPGWPVGGLGPGASPKHKEHAPRPAHGPSKPDKPNHKKQPQRSGRPTNWRAPRATLRPANTHAPPAEGEGVVGLFVVRNSDEGADTKRGHRKAKARASAALARRAPRCASERRHCQPVLIYER